MFYYLVLIWVMLLMYIVQLKAKHEPKCLSSALLPKNQLSFFHLCVFIVVSFTVCLPNIVFRAELLRRLTVNV